MKKGYAMKLTEWKPRVEHVCNYIIAGIEAQRLRAKYNELCEARAHAMEVELKLKAMLDKYE